MGKKKKTYMFKKKLLTFSSNISIALKWTDSELIWWNFLFTLKMYNKSKTYSCLNSSDGGLLEAGVAGVVGVVGVALNHQK